MQQADIRNTPCQGTDFAMVLAGTRADLEHRWEARSWLAPDHVNDRRKFIAAVRFDESGRERRVSFEMRAQVRATLDLVEKVE
ncbi:MAG: hypothetical protein M3178_18645 [Pseudomonadota bacterium]|nr:hypothetical protein [Pseudomonadota bacterium]